MLKILTCESHPFFCHPYRIGFRCYHTFHCLLLMYLHLNVYIDALTPSKVIINHTYFGFTPFAIVLLDIVLIALGSFFWVCRIPSCKNLNYLKHSNCLSSNSSSFSGDKFLNAFNEEINSKFPGDTN